MKKERAKVIQFESIQGRKPDPERRRKRMPRQQDVKMGFWDRVFVFISEFIELIAFPFVFLFNLVKESARGIARFFRKP